MSKKESRRVLQNKMSQVSDPGRKVTPEQLDDLALAVNLNVVSLYFEGFIREGQESVEICPPVVSTPVHHNSKYNEIYITDFWVLKVRHVIFFREKTDFRSLTFTIQIICFKREYISCSSI